VCLEVQISPAGAQRAFPDRTSHVLPLCNSCLFLLTPRVDFRDRQQHVVLIDPSVHESFIFGAIAQKTGTDPRPDLIVYHAFLCPEVYVITHFFETEVSSSICIQSAAEQHFSETFVESRSTPKDLKTKTPESKTTTFSNAAPVIGSSRLLTPEQRPKIFKG